MCVFIPKQGLEPGLSGLRMNSTAFFCSAWSYFGRNGRNQLVLYNLKSNTALENLKLRREEATDVLAAQH